MNIFNEWFIKQNLMVANQSTVDFVRLTMILHTDI
jgi:hypothetical protein